MDSVAGTLRRIATPARRTEDRNLVLLCLCPTVMLLSKSLSPALGHLGVKQSLSIFVGNVISVVLLQCVVVPTVSQAFRRWPDPIDGASARIGLVGAVVIVAVYAALLAIFTLIA